jgi:hypothetical protein
LLYRDAFDPHDNYNTPQVATGLSLYVKANWQFKTADARVKLKRLYPQFG